MEFQAGQENAWVGDGYGGQRAVPPPPPPPRALPHVTDQIAAAANSMAMSRSAAVLGAQEQKVEDPLAAAFGQVKEPQIATKEDSQYNVGSHKGSVTMFKQGFRQGIKNKSIGAPSHGFALPGMHDVMEDPNELFAAQKTKNKKQNGDAASFSQWGGTSDGGSFQAFPDVQISPAPPSFPPQNIPSFPATQNFAAPIISQTLVQQPPPQQEAAAAFPSPPPQPIAIKTNDFPMPQQEQMNNSPNVSFPTAALPNQNGSTPSSIRSGYNGTGRNSLSTRSPTKTKVSVNFNHDKEITGLVDFDNMISHKIHFDDSTKPPVRSLNDLASAKSKVKQAENKSSAFAPPEPMMQQPQFVPPQAGPNIYQQPNFHPQMQHAYPQMMMQPYQHGIAGQPNMMMMPPYGTAAGTYPAYMPAQNAPQQPGLQQQQQQQQYPPHTPLI
mmetsp:Transcript_10365/g.14312  ORF Transcript_10365/g.14312 Transcript_10365/m.14312 type:complete len:439 (+) Transcript_10365:110-1426(+)